ncbi:MAG: rhodanese-like domain-containing protein [Rhodospirillales bacterium]|nr:rhodanese-like domain-containing protein [Rhodospirillales bacterium]
MDTGIKPVKELVAEANKVVTTFSIDETLALQDAGDGVILDIRDVRELWRDGTVPGAIHTPRGMLEFWADPESPYHKDIFASGKTLILYCASAWRSALATKALQDMGVPHVAHMAGGFSAWKERDLPIETVTQK